MAKKFDVVGSGYVPCNKKRFKDARLVFFRPGWGVVSIEFGNGLDVGMRRDQRDEKGRLKDDFVRLVFYGGDIRELRDMGRRGIALWECSYSEFLFSRKAYPTGDLRDIIPDALDDVAVPNDRKRFFLLSKQGEFWDRPLPMGARTSVS